MSKRSRTLKNLIITLAFTGLLLYVCILVAGDRPQPAKPAVPAKTTEPCTPAAPCIEITQADGHKYKLNDFRFMPGHCVVFISIPDAVHRQTCGNYNLNWIGPDTSKPAGSNI